MKKIDIALDMHRRHEGYGCLNWTGKLNERGYGFVSHRGRTIVLHRAVWIELNGEIPNGIILRHKCDNPTCFYVEHLETGTHADNVADRVSRGRSAVGIQNGRAKLSNSAVLVIYESKLKHSVLADAFSVDHKVIRNIKSGKSWLDITRALRV